MRRKTSCWRLVEKSVKFVCIMPAYVKFTADVYECANCGNRTNDHKPLPVICPWCKAKMEDKA